MSRDQHLPSKSRVDRAGARLREQLANPVMLDAVCEETRESDIAVVSAYRRSYADPLLKVRMGLTSFKATIGCQDAVISQRTKRYNRIVTKLARFPKLRLSQMQDVGGVRLVLEDLNSSLAMVDRIVSRWEDQIRRHDDYQSDPQPSGYRSQHLIVDRDGRSIEIQVRTVNQHAWAESVESVGRLIGVELKWGEGPIEIRDYYALLGGIVDIVDRGDEVEDSLLEQARIAQENARRRILGLLRGGESDD